MYRLAFAASKDVGDGAGMLAVFVDRVKKVAQEVGADLVVCCMDYGAPLRRSMLGASKKPDKTPEQEAVVALGREALDILISDELGTRPYELYSGGEAFRINFALRVALSKLLARRAGASLRTLIVDEGFGTQDTQGRERLVESINAIQEDFDKVLVITHIDELKEAFPVRIEVFKTPSGSQIRVN